MSDFISNVLLTVVRSLERPLRLAGLDVFARRSDPAWRFFDFAADGTTYWGLGLEITPGRVPPLRWSDLRLNRWQVLNGLAWSARAFGWDVFVTDDDPRCGRLDFALKRDGREFQFYGLGLHVIGSPLRLSPR